jgi:hypothetical protein
MIQPNGLKLAGTLAVRISSWSGHRARENAMCAGFVSPRACGENSDIRVLICSDFNCGACAVRLRALNLADRRKITLSPVDLAL